MNLIGSLITLIYAVSMIYILLDYEVKHKKQLYLCGLFSAAVLAFDAFMVLTFGYSSFMKLYPLLIHVPSFIAFRFVSKYKGIKLIFVLLTVFVLTSPALLIGISISSFFDYKRSLINIVSLSIYIPVAFVVYKYLRPSFLYMLRNTNNGWFGFCTIPISYYALIYLVGMYDISSLKERSNIMIMALALFLTIASYVMILRFFKQTREQLILQNEQNLLRTQIDAAKVHLNALKESQEKTTIYRHDMRHHLNLIGSYLSDDNRAAAQKYINEVEKAIEGAVVEKYCNNYTVNLILSSYINKAKNEQINVETQINLPEKNTVSDMDLCVIFANAIENATNACKQLPSANDRIIKIICKTENDKIFIQISNSYDGLVSFVDDMPVSTAKNHGLGTKSIAAVVQKYGGVYSFTADKEIFKTSIIV